jgi:fructokinase
VTDDPVIVGLGEVLWDFLPSGRVLGGAPANFAYCSYLLGNRAVIASRTGDDQLSRELREGLAARGVGQEFLQMDGIHPTGTVLVQLNSSGQPTFEITQPSAWDFLEFSDGWKALANKADAVCFGSLAQRSPVSRRTILDFLDATRKSALRIFDVNLRQSFYSDEIIHSSLQKANVLKLNHEEMPILAEMIKIESRNEIAFCQEIVRRFPLTVVCVTRGANGSVLVDGAGVHEHGGFRVKVADTVGAGDAFTAGLVHELLRGSTLQAASGTANRMGAWVASKVGAMPAMPEGGIESALARVASV